MVEIANTSGEQETIEVPVEYLWAVETRLDSGPRGDAGRGEYKRARKILAEYDFFAR